MKENQTDIQPIISFIVTDYNLPIQLLRECIESILSLDLRPEEREIILVDDGSETSPISKLSDVEKYISYVRQENQGLSVARNKGIEKAHGKYIQFVDGDDYLLTKAYNQILKQVRTEKYDLIQFAFARTHIEKEIAAERKNLFVTTYADDYLKHHNLQPAAWGYVFKSQLLGNLRFTTGVYHEDEEFTPLLFLHCSNIAYTKIRAYFYRQRSGSITTDESDKHIEKRFRDYFGIIVKLRDYSNKEKRGVLLKRRVNQMIMDYLYNYIILFKDMSRLESMIDMLKKYQFFPLPLYLYTWKYVGFSLMMRYRFTRRIVFNILTK